MYVTSVLSHARPSDFSHSNAHSLQTVEALAGVAAELALRLYLQCAEVRKASLLLEIMRMVVTKCAGCVSQAASEGEVEDMAYEFFTQAFVLYEEDISVSGYVPFPSLPLPHQHFFFFFFKLIKKIKK